MVGERMPLLEVQGLVKYYGRRRVVNGVSFHVERGEVVGLLGPNGAGKTTSFRMTTGMITPKDGKVIFNGQEVTSWPMYKRARLGMGYLSQEKSVFRKLTVEQNILAILEALPSSRSLGRRLTSRERWERTEHALDEFGLIKVRKSLAQYLSGGECRRLEIARCLVCEPLLILLDEPFTGIDPKTIGEIQNIVRRLRQQGIGLLLTDHNVREALKITDRSYVITDGTVEAHGTPEEIVRHPLVIQKYLGESFSEDPLARFGTPPLSPEVVPLTRAAELPPPPPPSIHSLLEQEHILELVEALKTDARHEAERELVQIGYAALPILLQVLERTDLEMRRMAYHVLQRIDDRAGHFDPYAPQVQRRQQIDRLRDQFRRKAG
jgi:lipopolysaccharide export system ATP-binding protein